MNDTAEIDTLLWKAVRGDDYTAFEELFHRYYPSLCRYAKGIVGNKVQAEDVVQDTFIHFWEHREAIELNKSVSSCLYIAVRNRSLRVLENQIREQKHYPRLAENLGYLMASEYSPEEEKQIERVREVMLELPPQCLKVFIMGVLEGKKYTEIAEELSISVNTVKTHITKAYRILRKQFQEDTSCLFYFFLAFAEGEEFLSC